jgi:hypothetical protein
MGLSSLRAQLRPFRLEYGAGPRLKLLARERPSRVRLLGSLGSLEESPARCPRAVRTASIAKKFGARVEAIFSARLTMHTGRIANPLTIYIASYRFRGLPGFSRPRDGMGTPEPAIFCFRYWCGDRHLLGLHQRPIGRAVGQALTRPPLNAMVGLELDIAGGKEFHLSSPGNKPEVAADASRDAIVSQRALGVWRSNRSRWRCRSSRASHLQEARARPITGAPFSFPRLGLSSGAAPSARLGGVRVSGRWIPASRRGSLFRVSHARQNPLSINEALWMG